MSICLLRTIIFAFVISVGVTSREQQKSLFRIYSYFTEVIQPVDKLPLEFSNDDWINIRADSITLVGEDVNITSQSITQKKKSLNGADIYIRSPVAFDKKTVAFLRATIVDEDRYLVKVQDDSIYGKEALYFIVSPQDIYYTEEPSNSKHYVDFTYTSSNSDVYVSYLRSNLFWRVQYQLNLYNDVAYLFATANIRNDGNSYLLIDQAELLGGAIHIQMPYQQYNGYNLEGANTWSYDSRGYRTYYSGESVSMVGQGQEVMGVHVFSVYKPFAIDAQTNYLLPIFHSEVKVKRYNSISKTFTAYANNGNAQRLYRLISDQYLPTGNCIIREFDRIVGEAVIPNLGANNQYEFSIGEESEVVYNETVTFNSTDEVSPSPADPSYTYSRMYTRNIYIIDVEIKNLKDRSVQIEYTQQFYGRKIDLIECTADVCSNSGLAIKFNVTLNANEVKVYSYNVGIMN